jgi:hypothetical protein
LSRVHPGEAFNAPGLKLTAIAAQKTICWVGTDAGLMRFDPGTQVWSRFAIDRSHLDVPIDGLEIADGKLTVRFGAESANFDLTTRCWLAQTAQPLAEFASEPASEAAPRAKGFSLTMAVIAGIAAIVLLLAGFLILRK